MEKENNQEQSITSSAPPLCPPWKKPCSEVEHCQWRVNMAQTKQSILGGQPTQTVTQVCFVEALMIQGSGMDQKISNILAILQQLQGKGPMPFGKG